MMKRVMILGILTISLIVVTGSLQSQTAVTIGGHYWYAQPTYKGDTFENVEVGPGNMFGPYLNLRVGKIALGTSMFFGTFNWDYKDYGFEFDIKRTDLNFSVGYSVARGITLFGAVKSLSLTGDQDVEYEYYDWEWDTYYTYTAKVKAETKGTLYGGGISGVVPVGQSSFFLFYSAAYLSGKIEMTSSISIVDQTVEDTTENETSITAVTVGLGAQAGSGITLMVGYRADLSGEDEGEERIHGIMATMAYTIR